MCLEYLKSGGEIKECVGLEVSTSIALCHAPIPWHPLGRDESLLFLQKMLTSNKMVRLVSNFDYKVKIHPFSVYTGQLQESYTTGCFQNRFVKVLLQPKMSRILLVYTFGCMKNQGAPYNYPPVFVKNKFNRKEKNDCFW